MSMNKSFGITDFQLKSLLWGGRPRPPLDLGRAGCPSHRRSNLFLRNPLCSRTHTGRFLEGRSRPKATLPQRITVAVAFADAPKE